MKSTILIIDNFDSFTFNLVDYFARFGVDCIVRRNNVLLGEIINLDFDSIVLSPGPGKPSEAGICMQILSNYYQKKPILGICLGHQAIGEFFGATLRKASKPMHGKVSEITTKDHPIFKDIPTKIKVVRYHSLLIDKLPLILESLSETNQGEVMAISHTHLPIVGIQYHPEAHLTEFGLQLIQNWINISLLYRD